jgi:hypothetical protein
MPRSDRPKRATPLFDASVRSDRSPHHNGEKALRVPLVLAWIQLLRSCQQPVLDGPPDEPRELSTHPLQW